MVKKKRDRDAIRKIVEEIADMPFKELEKRGHHIKVGEENIKTERDIVKLHQGIEISLWREIRSQYDLDDC